MEEVAIEVVNFQEKMKVFWSKNSLDNSKGYLSKSFDKIGGKNKLIFQTLESETFYKKSYSNVKIRHLIDSRISSLRNDFHKVYEKLATDPQAKYGNSSQTIKQTQKRK